MRAVSSPLFQHGRLIDSRVAFLLAAVLVLALLASAVLYIGASAPSQPDPDSLVAPFRWMPLDRASG